MVSLQVLWEGAVTDSRPWKSQDTDNASCFLGSDDSYAWHYWPPSEALKLRLSSQKVLERNRQALNLAPAKAQLGPEAHDRPGSSNSWGVGDVLIGLLIS
eukprot:Skav204258  [mRNA]  locus=scaffold912:177707:178006:- [translate_table: standard]